VELGKTHTQLYEMLKAIYGDEVMLRTQASESLLRCEEGWDNKTNDEECE
jgi:hypothetical protein